MIWKLEGDLYRVELLDYNMFKAMRDFEEEHPLNSEYPIFVERNFLTLQSLSTVTRMILFRPDGTEQEVLEHFNNDPRSAYCVKYSSELPVQPMLVPLDKDRHPIDRQLANAFPMGEVIPSGYLHTGKHTTGLPYTHLTENFHLVDEPGKDLSPNQIWNWVFYDGCYISSRQLAISDAKTMWELMYVNRNERIPA